MGKYEVNSKGEVEETLRENFPNTSYSNALELVERIHSLAPDTVDKAEYLLDLMSLVNDLLSGDDIRAYYGRAFSRFGKLGLEELSKISHSEKMEALRLERVKLQKEIESLHQQKEILTEQIETLDSDKRDLISKTTLLDKEQEALSKSLEDLKENGKKQAEEEIREEKERITKEINSLNAKKEALNTTVEEYKQILIEYRRKIANLGNDSEIEWLPADKDVVYSLTKSTISNYIEDLVSEYVEMTGIDRVKAIQDIRKNSMGLFSIKDLLNNDIKFGVENPTVGYILRTYWSVDEAIQLGDALKYAVKNVKVPYTKAINNRKNIGIPDDISSLSRELHFQKMVANAVAQQKIAEAQLNMVLQILQRVLPSECDINSIIAEIGPTPDCLLGASDAPKLTLESAKKSVST